MKSNLQSDTEFATPNPIRVETALSRYPVHRLAKHGDIAIDIREKTERGEVSIKWEVNHISKFGQPGPLAYKLDTLIINRRIEEAVRPISRIIRLGSLSEICRELNQADSGKNTNHIKTALRQNAFAAIIAKIRYRLSDGTESFLEADFNRYSVVFTGEKLPDGRKANAVYIILNDVYMQVINGAMTRPLDYDYLRILPPAAQRFYELLSYQMYAAIKNDRPRARILYSELCRYAPLMRQTDWNVVRPQLARIHAPHKKSGYIAKFDCQDTTDSDGKPDWVMLYQPGPKARAEFRAFTKRGGPVTLEIEPFAANPLPLPLLAAAKPSPLEAELIAQGVSSAMACELVREYGEDPVKLQVEHLAWQMEKKPGKIADPAAWLVTAIKSGMSLPKGFITAAERKRRQEATAAKDRASAEERRITQAAAAHERHLAAQVAAYRQSRTQQQLTQIEAAAIAQASEETRASLNDPVMKPFRKTLISRLIEEHIARSIQAEQMAAEPA